MYVPSKENWKEEYSCSLCFNTLQLGNVTRNIEEHVGIEYIDRDCWELHCLLRQTAFSFKKEIFQKIRKRLTSQQGWTANGLLQKFSLPNKILKNASPGARTVTVLARRRFSRVNSLCAICVCRQSYGTRMSFLLRFMSPSDSHRAPPCWPKLQMFGYN